MMNNMANNVAVVVGRNYCNILTTARALGEAGYDVEVLKVFKVKPNPLKFLRLMKPEAYSKYVTKYTEIVTNGKIEKIADYLVNNANANQKKLLIPVDDYVCCAIDNELDRLNDLYFAPSIKASSGEIARLMDKNEQKNRALACNIPMLQGWLIKSSNGSFEIPKDVKYPCFVKPNVSMQSTKSKMQACQNEAELSAALSKYATQGDFEMLVEELANIKEEFSILGVSDGKEAVSAGVFRAIKGGNRDRKGVAIVGEIVNSNRFEDIIQKCNDFVKSLGYVGLFDIDLIEDKNCNIYFVEINFRAGASTYALNKSGVNLYGMFADCVMKAKPIDKSARVNESKIFVSEKVLMEEYARGDATASDVKKYMKQAEIFFVKDENDIKPYKYFKKFYFRCAIMRVIYKILDKIKRTAY